jgi:hypothetical protein
LGEESSRIPSPAKGERARVRGPFQDVSRSF